MKQAGLFFAVFLAAGAVNIATSDASATFVVVFVAAFVLIVYARLYPDKPTEDR